MIRSRATVIVSALLIIVLGVWIARNTAWVRITIPMPPRGEAARNPFYGAQRFSETLGALAYWDRTLQLPRSDGVLVLSAWRWSLSAPRRLALERWVESGGHLVVDRSVVTDRTFADWSGVALRARRNTEPGEPSEPGERGRPEGDATEARRDAAAPDEPEFAPGARLPDDCRAIRETIDPDGRPANPPIAYELCGVYPATYLIATRSPSWALMNDRDALQAVRVPAGRGSVTVLNAVPYRSRAMLEGDHARIFVAATRLRRGQMVRFLSEEDHPSLLVLIWQQGAAVVLLTLAAIGLALWRGAARFGPLAAPAAIARRSLTEQIVGTGRFAVQRGDGAALHAALVRGVDDAARRRVPGYARLSAGERAAAVAALTGMDGDALTAALLDPERRRPERLRATLALLELARRRTLVAHTRSSHGTE